jgi:hypothetical protein
MMAAMYARPLIVCLSLLGACSTGRQQLSGDGPTRNDSQAKDQRADRPSRRDGKPGGDGTNDSRLGDGPVQRDRSFSDGVKPDATGDLAADRSLPPDVGTDLFPDTNSDGNPRFYIFHDFDRADGGLSGTLDWEWNLLNFVAGSDCDSPPVDHPIVGRSGKGVWGTVVNSCYVGRGNASGGSCGKGDNAQASVLTWRVALPANLRSAELRYWQWSNISTPYDWAETRVNGAVVADICLFGSLSSAKAWKEVIVDLQSHIGTTVTISFHFAASGVVQMSGWYLDDLAIIGY